MQQDKYHVLFLFFTQMATEDEYFVFPSYFLLKFNIVIPIPYLSSSVLWLCLSKFTSSKNSPF